MAKKRKVLETKEVTEENREYLRRIFATLKRLENVMGLVTKKGYNMTEIRLMSEVVLANCENRRLISTQIARRLGITRSAVSQIVNKLEEKGVICRVADDVDKKIAYIELSQHSREQFEEDVREYNELVHAVVTRFGVSKMEKLLTLIGEFEEAVVDVKGNTKSEE